MSRPTLRSLQPLARQLSTTTPISASVASSSSSSSVAAQSQTSPPPPSSFTAEESISRVYPPRKAFLHAYYSHLLTSSQLVLLFSHDNLSVKDLNKIRRAIAKLPPPPSSSTTAPTDDEEAKATLTIARTGLLASLFRQSSPSSTSSHTSATPSLLPHLTGPTALLTSPSLSPPYLSKILTTITRQLKTSQREFPASTPPEVAASKQPSLTVVAGILEGNRLVDVSGIADVAKLPDIDTLRAQLVGLLESPGRQVVGLLGQAAGGQLVRTLQGLEEGLKEKESA